MTVKFLIGLTIIGLFYFFIKKEEAFIFHTPEKTISKGNLKQLFPPFSTFKLPLSLFSNIQKNTQKSWKWDGKKRFFPEWNQDQTRHSWIQNSCVWVSERIIKNDSETNLKSFLENLNYGNKKINNSLFWIDGTLKISISNQIQVIIKLLKNDLFEKELFFIEENKSYTVYGKTGTGKEGGGWFIGWVNKDKIEYPFAYFINNVTGRQAKLTVLSKLKKVFK